MNAAAVTWMVGAWLAAAAPAYHIEKAPARRIEAVLTMRAELPAMAAKEWVLFAARPPELLGQGDLSATLSPSGRPHSELSPQRRGILWARVPTRGKQWTSGITVEARYRATLFSRRLRAGPPAAGGEPIAPLAPQQRRFSLEATPLVDFESQPLRQWLDKHRLHRGEDEGEIEFARRVYLKGESLIQKLGPSKYHPDMIARVGGAYRSFREFDQAISDIRTASIASLLMVLGLLVVFFRRLRSIVIVLVPLLVGIAWAAGFAALAFGKMNIITSFIAAILIGLGIDFAIHLYAAYRSHRLAGEDMEETLRTLFLVLLASFAFSQAAHAQWQGKTMRDVYPAREVERPLLLPKGWIQLSFGFSQHNGTGRWTPDGEKVDFEHASWTT